MNDSLPEMPQEALAQLVIAAGRSQQEPITYEDVQLLHDWAVRVQREYALLQEAMNGRASVLLIDGEGMVFPHTQQGEKIR